MYIFHLNKEFKVSHKGIISSSKQHPSDKISIKWMSHMTKLLDRQESIHNLQAKILSFLFLPNNIILARLFLILTRSIIIIQPL
jgi:hypothetical protein